MTRSFSISRVALDPAAAKKATKLSEEESDEPKSIAKRGGKKSTRTEKKSKKVPAKRAVEEKETKPKAMKISEADKPPKRPAGSWSRFLSKFIEDNKSADSSASVAEYSKNASSIWNAMSEHEKAPYEDAYKQGWQEYLVKFQEYSKTADPKVIKELNARRGKKGLKKIRLSVNDKRPTNGFIRFLIARREASGFTSSGIKESAQFARESGVEWRALSDAEKQVYQDTANKDLKEWQERQKDAST